MGVPDQALFLIMMIKNPGSFHTQSPVTLMAGLGKLLL